jgi:putative tricarboxylic transport membrane protein
MRRDEIIGNIVIVGFFIFMLANSFKLHEIRRFGETGSGFWPILILSAAVILSATLLISSVVRYLKAKRQASGEPPLSPEAAKGMKVRRKKIVLSALLLLLYIVVMSWVGFGLSTLIYVLAFILVLGERRKFVLILSPLLVTVLVILIFSRFIAIPFPKGVGIFAAFSRLFY